MKEFAPETLRIGPDGTLTFSEDQRNRWGLTPGSAVVIRQTPNGLLVFPEDPPLGRVYIEPTSACNLNCRTCMRHSWTEPIGSMTMATFNSLIEGLRRAAALHTASFWGMGEPLLHLCIVDSALKTPSPCSKKGSRAGIVAGTNNSYCNWYDHMQ